MNLRNSDLFETRHLGLNNNDEKIMLNKLGFNLIEDFIDQVVPKDIQIKNRYLNYPDKSVYDDSDIQLIVFGNVKHDRK